MFEKLFYRISDLGKLPSRIIASIFKQIVRFVKNVFKFNKSSVSKKAIAIRCVVLVLVAAIITSTAFTLSKNSRIDAICISVGDKVIGYTNSQTDADIAKANALKILGSGNFDNISEAQARVMAHEIKSSSDISDLIVKELCKDYINAYEIYVADKLIGVVKNPNEARDAINNVYTLANKVYSNSTSSFSQSIKLSQRVYPADSKSFTSTEELQTKINSEAKILYAQCEKAYADTPYETVEVQTNTLFVGDSRIRRDGTNGKEYNVNLVTYIDNQKVYTEELMSIPITAPVSRIVERGVRANNLSMGEYTVLQTTGMFCWPVVDLYTVTSPYGHRSLGYHQGIDISGANASGKFIVAGAGGVITEAGWSTGGYGYYVKIDHGNGVETLYAHMLENSIMVNVGDTVVKGQVIGKVGNTGYSFGAHLHFEVRVNGNRLDPAPFLGLQ